MGEFLEERLNVLISGGILRAKAPIEHVPDIEVRQRGERKGLDTPVVHAVNDDHRRERGRLAVSPSLEANAVNGPPEEYDLRIETQRNRRGLTQVVDHVV
jgi:hypothetical protein